MQPQRLSSRQATHFFKVFSISNVHFPNHCGAGNGPVWKRFAVVGSIPAWAEELRPILSSEWKRQGKEEQEADHRRRLVRSQAIKKSTIALSFLRLIACDSSEAPRKHTQSTVPSDVNRDVNQAPACIKTHHTMHIKEH